MLHKFKGLFLVFFISLNLSCSRILSKQSEPSINENLLISSNETTQSKKLEKKENEHSVEELKYAKERISKAVFHSDILWTLGQNGILLKVNLTKKKAEQFEFASYIADIYINTENELYVLASEKEDSQDWQILKQQGNDWFEIANLKLIEKVKKKDEVKREIIGLTEFQNRFLVLATNKVYLQEKNNVWKTINFQNEGSLGLQTPFAVTENGFIYVGLNHGEFGGGLLQFDLKDGSVKSIEKKTVGKICSRPLDAQCDPITSVIRDPENPNAILAGIGLRHFSETGRIVKVSSDEISVVFNKNYKYDENSKDILPANPCESANEPNSLENFESEGIFGMQSNGNNTWIITGRAIYNLKGEKIQTCEKLKGKFEDIDGVMINQDYSGIVVLGTDINWAKSLSGTTPLIVIKR